MLGAQFLSSWAGLLQIKDEGGQGTSEQYSSAIAEMSASGEWMSCAELLTEAKLLRLSLEQEALESAAAVLSGPEGARMLPSGPIAPAESCIAAMCILSLFQRG